MNYKIRDAQTKKIPLMIIVGKREQADNLISVRHRDSGDQGQMSFDEFMEKFGDEFKRPEIELTMED